VYNPLIVAAIVLNFMLAIINYNAISTQEQTIKDFRVVLTLQSRVDRYLVCLQREIVEKMSGIVTKEDCMKELKQ
jgi:hypothetical protein